MKINSVGAEIFHADFQTDKYDETNTRSSFPQFCLRAKSKISTL